EYLEILPSLAAGVIVHVHDIFSPRDYPRGWVLGELKLWNEQYLLEAFLAHNRAWKIVGALNFLKHRHYEALARVCPYLSPEREPGSFYIEKIE
ncbi:MAG: class I SAM-dependent methyltransferase, partial [Steroidobacteraceae bacterium]